MLTIRRARKEDLPFITALLQRLDNYLPLNSVESFWVADANDKIVGVARLEEFSNFSFLSFVGIDPKRQSQGLARGLLEEMLKNITKDVYLYTVIPDFFEKFGFEITAPIPGLPSKTNLGCEDCSPEKCVCMVRKTRNHLQTV